MNRSHTQVQFADNFTSDLTDAEYAEMLGTLDPEHDKLVPKPDEPDYVPDELDP